MSKFLIDGKLYDPIKVEIRAIGTKAILMRYAMIAAQNSGNSTWRGAI